MKNLLLAFFIINFSALLAEGESALHSENKGKILFSNSIIEYNYENEVTFVNESGPSDPLNMVAYFSSTLKDAFSGRLGNLDQITEIYIDGVLRASERSFLYSSIKDKITAPAKHNHLIHSSKLFEAADIKKNRTYITSKVFSKTSSSDGIEQLITKSILADNLACLNKPSFTLKIVIKAYDTKENKPAKTVAEGEIKIVNPTGKQEAYNELDNISRTMSVSPERDELFLQKINDYYKSSTSGKDFIFRKAFQFSDWSVIRNDLGIAFAYQAKVYAIGRDRKNETCVLKVMYFRKKYDYDVNSDAEPFIYFHSIYDIDKYMQDIDCAALSK